jgi:hypothetical protein
MGLAIDWRSGMGIFTTPMEEFLGFCLMILYISCLFTVCLLTFKKGHTLLGILGIFLPLLWLIGACLPAKEGSRAWVEEGMRRQADIQRMTQ